MSLSPWSRCFSQEGVGSQEREGSGESEPVSAWALAEETLRPRARPGSRSLLVVEVPGELLQPTS